MLHAVSPLPSSELESMLAAYPFHPTVFVLPPWEAIYATDSERDQTFADAVDVHDRVVQWYRSCGYMLHEVPRLPVARRAQHVLHTLSAVALMLLTFSIRAWAGQAQNTPAFEVVSVKPSAAQNDQTASFVQPGARYTAINVTLRMLVKTAYGVHDDQIAGGPSWIDTERFDVTAKAEGNPPGNVFRDQARLMLRQALADRFKLVLRTERREIPIYALVVARDDERFGPQLTRSDASECSGAPKVVPTAPNAPEPNVPMPCGSGFSRAAHVAARGMEFSTLVTSISSWADRLVLDRTGLTGKFDWDLQWSMEPLTPDAARASGVSLFTAVREQLGLRLESQRGMADVLVVDAVERPTPD